MTAVQITLDEFEQLDELQAERWIAHRFRQFVDLGFPAELSLLFAVHPEITTPNDEIENAA